MLPLACGESVMKVSEVCDVFPTDSLVFLDLSWRLDASLYATMIASYEN